MLQAGSLTTSVSNYVRPPETLVGSSHHANALKVSSNVQFSQHHSGFGHSLHSDETVIGLAIGSPRQSPTLAMSPNEPDVDASWAYSPLENKPARSLEGVYEIGSESRSIKRKVREWKSFGSFFGKREVQSASPCDLQDQKQKSVLSKPLVVQDRLGTDAPPRQGADLGQDSKMHYPGFSKHIFRKESTGLLRRDSSRRRRLRRRKLQEPQSEMQQIPAEYTADTIAESLEARGEQQKSRMPGLLQVEIPCVAMERYSVMFGEVLKSQALQSKCHPSLLACGQAKPEELHPVGDPNSKPLNMVLPKTGMQANSTSPTSSKSSSVSLFSSTPPNPACSQVNKLLQKPSPLSRSSTDSGHCLLPPKPTVQKSKSQDQDRVLVLVHKSEGTSGNGGSQHSPNPSQCSAKSAKASLLGYPAIGTGTPTSTNAAPPKTLHHAFPARKSSMKTILASEPPYVHQGEDQLSSTAQVSVARQISISRRQRQILVPIAPKIARQPIQPWINEQSNAEGSRQPHNLTLQDA